MPVVEPTREDLDRMAHIRREVEKAIVPYRNSIEAAIVCGALFQIARTLLELYPEATRRDLLTGAVAFLRHEDLEGRPDQSFLVPKGLIQ